MNQLQQILQYCLNLFIAIPLIAFIVTLFLSKTKEKAIANIVQFTKAFYIIAAIALVLLWLSNGYVPIHFHLLALYKSSHFVFALQFYYDATTAVYSVVGAVLFFIVATFSKYYMHRDEGFKRFFNTILFFAVGYNIIIFSGNFETLFIGWEFIGLASFLLIAFYRNRYLPVKNGFKVLSNYRLSDVALMLAMWMMHHLTHQNISFGDLGTAKIMANTFNHNGMATFIVIMIILAATIKSAQFPFTTWLPRAMEGPTSSSAIFYGSLSVHIGVFLLLRTYPFWNEMLWAKIAIIVIGVTTGIVATLIARTQPTVKTQIAYASAAQIGLIFIEVALGLHWLALLHFAGNAFLRTYQLLVSPSVLNYLVHHQIFHYTPKISKPLPKTNATLYMLGIKEWNLDSILQKYLWQPFKWIGKKMQFIEKVPISIGFALVLLAISAKYFFKIDIAKEYKIISLTVFLSIALLLILFAFSARGCARVAFSQLFNAQLLIVLGFLLSNTDTVQTAEFIMYISGILVAYLIGIFCLHKIKNIDHDISLNKYHGYVYEKKQIAFLFFIATIGIICFPITAAFISIDIFFTYIQSYQYVQIALLALCLIFIELAAIRIYLRVFLGPHKKLNHPVAYRNS